MRSRAVDNHYEISDVTRMEILQEVYQDTSYLFNVMHHHMAGSG